MVPQPKCRSINRNKFPYSHLRLTRSHSTAPIFRARRTGDGQNGDRRRGVSGLASRSPTTRTSPTHYCHHPDDRGRVSRERQGGDGRLGDVVWGEGRWKSPWPDRRLGKWVFIPSSMAAVKCKSRKSSRRDSASEPGIKLAPHTPE